MTNLHAQPAGAWLQRGALSLTLAWVGMMAYLAIVPRVPEVPGVTSGQAATLGHLAVHAGLGGLLFLTLTLWPAHRSRWRRTALLAIAIPILYGAVLEGLQLFLPARSASAFDLILNATGAVTGMIAALLVSAMLNPHHVWTIVGAATAAAIVLVPVWFVAEDPSLPRVGDHWHAQYSISICSEDIPPLPGTHGAIHTHGDGLIHIHPFTRSGAGRNATLAVFMHTSGGTLTDDSIVLPTGDRYGNGDACPSNEPGALMIWVNGQPANAGSAYVPRDGDRILLVFGTAP